MCKAQSKFNLPANMSVASAVNKDTQLWATTISTLWIIQTRWYTQEYVNHNTWNSVYGIDISLWHITAHEAKL